MGNFRFFNRPDIIYRTLDSIDKLDWRSDNLTKKSYKEKENLTFTNNIHLTSFEETVSSSDEDININLNSKENQLEHQNKQILSKKSSVASVDSAFVNSCNHINNNQIMSNLIAQESSSVDSSTGVIAPIGVVGGNIPVTNSTPTLLNPNIGSGLNSAGINSVAGITNTNILGNSVANPVLDSSIGGDPELEEIKRKVKEMEQEAQKLADMQKEVELAMDQGGSSSSIHVPAHQPSTAVLFPSLEEKIEADARSIYVGQVEYSATAEEVELHFRGCGALNRVTILCDKFTGHPKGYAYIEFADKESVETAIGLDGSIFKGRPIKVMPKRTNKPGITIGERGAIRSRGRGRGRGRGMMRGRGIRGRGRGGYMGMRGGFGAPY